MIIGRKLKTLPTPVHIPSVTRDLSTALTPALVNKISRPLTAALIPLSSKSDIHAPKVLKVSTKIEAIIMMKDGIAVYFPVSIRSIFSLRICSLLILGLITVFLQILLM